MIISEMIKVIVQTLCKNIDVGFNGLIKLILYSMGSWKLCERIRPYMIVSFSFWDEMMKSMIIIDY